MSEDDKLQPVTDDLLMSPEERSQLKPFVVLNAPDPLDETPLPVGGDSLSEFDRRYREPFTGLLYLGKLEKTVSLFGHSFDLRTPNQAEKIEGGILHKPYLNSISSELAWATITVATYLRSVDGSPLPEPLGPKDSGLKDRFNWVLENLRNQVVQALFVQCLALEEQVDAILKEFDRLGESFG